jgi:cysteine desulfurase
MIDAAIYLDHAATTMVRPEVRDAMLPYLGEAFGNPSSIHQFGQRARMAIDQSRDIIARSIGAAFEEIVFTSGGTEADNLALAGAVFAKGGKRAHIVTSAIEHEAILKTAEFLEHLGNRVSRVGVDKTGMVAPEVVEAEIGADTVLVSVMHANNEVGTIEPIRDIAAIAHLHGIPFHSDAVQTFGQLPVDVDDLAVDMLSLSAHKIYGPKGVGALYIRHGTQIEPLIHGGGQERERRSGTENVAGIVGFAEAVRLMIDERAETSDRVRAMRDAWLKSAAEQIPGISLNGAPEARLANNINISVPNIEGEAILLNLDIAGIAVSSGSACTAGSIEPSHVLVAMGLPDHLVRSAVRITMGRTTTPEQMDELLATLKEIVHRLTSLRDHGLSQL